MARRQVLCHGDDRRFDAVAELVDGEFGKAVAHIGDIAGGQGMLSRILSKRYNYDCEVIDPREGVLVGVAHCCEPFTPGRAGYYDLIVGLHPDEALRAVVAAALVRPTILVPCCNYWARRRMGITELLADIGGWYAEHSIDAKRVELAFSSPYRHAFVTRPPRHPPLEFPTPGPHNDHDEDVSLRGSRRRAVSRRTA